jgi:hypothetical protein
MTQMAAQVDSSLEGAGQSPRPRAVHWSDGRVGTKRYLPVTRHMPITPTAAPSSISRGASMVYGRRCVKNLVTFVAAVFRIAKMSFRMWAAVIGCVRINHTMSARKRNPTSLDTANHRSTPVGGTLNAYLYRTDLIGGIQRGTGRICG